MHDERYCTTRTLIEAPPQMGHSVAGGLRTRGFGKRSTPDLPLISVVTVVFNGRAHLRQTIESVLSQSWNNVEYVIVDGGSTDGTLDIIRSFDHALDYWISEPDAGIYDAMNKGIRLTTGAWVGLINADDWYLPEAIQLVADTVRHNPADIVFGAKAKVDKDDLVQTISSPVPSRGDRNVQVHRVHPATFVRSELYAQFLYDTTYPSSADMDFFIKAVKAGASFQRIDSALAFARSGGFSSGMHLENAAIRARHYGIIDGALTATNMVLRRLKSRLSRKLRSPEELMRRKLADGWVPFSEYAATVDNPQQRT